MISMIVAVAKNRVIGNKNTIPWNFPPYKMSADFKYFKNTTLGKTIVMGLNTFKSIGEKPLPGRKHIILCDKPDYKVPDQCILAWSFDEALKLIKSEENYGKEIFICGGAYVYKQFLPYTDKLYITEIHANPEGDTYFPEINKEEWKEVSREEHKADEKNSFDYSFVILERK